LGKISIILRTYNEEKFIGRLFEVLNSQKNSTNYEFEVIVIDSSTDETPNIARRYNAQVIVLPQSEFNWAYALNLGIKNSTGDLILIMSAHAIPVDNTWLDLMTSPFSDEKTAGVYCRQIPWPDAPWNEVYRLNKTFQDQSQRFDRSTSCEYMHFSNAASCIRRSIWEKHNFEILPASEDMEWAHWAINNNYNIIYQANARVYHSHNESARYTAKKGIEIEINTDLQLNRKRSLFFTIWQAIKWVRRDATKIITLETGRKKLFSNLWECLLRSYWFIFDFNKIQKSINQKTKNYESGK
jgi:rhamnosyltransferase